MPPAFCLKRLPLLEATSITHTSLSSSAQEARQEGSLLQSNCEMPWAGGETSEAGVSNGNGKEDVAKALNATTLRRRRDVRAARDRLGEQFEQLRKILPRGQDGNEEGGGVGAKAQVLERSVEEIERLMRQATDLAVELVVVSSEATRRWVREVCRGGDLPVVEGVGLVMKLFAWRGKWRYGEWWRLDEGRGGGSGVAEDRGNVYGCVVRDSVSVMRLGWSFMKRDGRDGLELERFAMISGGYEFRPRVGMPGRVWTSRRAEWLVDLDDGETFVRNGLAAEFGMKTCLAVPICFGGYVHSVMAFFSTEVRPYKPECYELACLLASSLEDVYGSILF